MAPLDSALSKDAAESGGRTRDKPEFLLHLHLLESLFPSGMRSDGRGAGNIGALCPRATESIALKLRFTSASVVAQEDTLMRIAFLPFHVVPPHQHVPSCCMPRMTRSVFSSSPKDTRT